MSARLASRIFAAFVVALMAALLPASATPPPAVRVTLQVDNTLLKVGDSTTAHVMAQIVPDQLPNTLQIVTWYVDLLNTAPSVIQIDPTTIVVPSSDSDPSTSSKGTLTAGNLRGVYDTFLNSPGAGHDTPVELFSVKIKAAAVGSATFSVAAGTTAPALDEDFTVATTTGGSLFGGLYDTATAQVSSFNNVPPTIDPIADITVAEGTRMSVTAVGHDADVGQTLRYSMAGLRPGGATLDPVTGILVWTPTEQQGPATYAMKIKVTDNGTPPLSATNSFNVIVTEVNVPPTLQVPATINASELQAISAICTASDTDYVFNKSPETNRLTFSLLSAPPGATINATNGAFAWTPTEAQGPGSYTIKVVVTDDGVPPMAATNSFTINVAEQNLPPTITAPPAQTIAEGATMNVAFVAKDNDLPANQLTFKIVSAPPGVLLDPSSGLVTWTPTEAQGPGVYTIRVAVTDNAPIPLSATNSMQVTVTELNSSPTLDVLQDRTVAELTPLTFTAVAHDTDLPAQTLTFSLDNPPAGATINPISGAFAWTPTEAQGPGRYTVVVRVIDSGTPVASDTKSFDVVVTEANSAPTLTTPAGKASQTVAELTPVSIQFTATDSDVPANLISFSLQNAPTGAAIDAASGLFTWTPSEAQGPGSYSIKVVATDNGVPPLSSTNTIAITVTEASTPPVIDAIPNQTVDELTKLTLQVTAHDSDLPAQTLTYSLGVAPAGVAIDPVTGVLTWTPTEAQGPGNYSIAVRVTESGTAALTATQTFFVAVNEVNTPPQFTPVGPITVPEMAPISNVRVSAQDSDVLNGQTPNKNTITYTLLDAPSGMTIDAQTGSLSWTPTEDQGPGSYQVRVSAIDDGVPPQSTTTTLTVNVTEVNRAPSITAPPSQTIPELVAFTTTFTATDPDLPANTLSFFLVQAPAGVKLDATTGVVTWTPTEAQGPGTYAIKVAVSDNGSPALFATNTVNITVTEVNTKPTLASIPDFVVAGGTTLSFIATASDSDLPAQTLTFSLDAAPQGATINGSTGAFTWTPATALAGQQFTVTVRVIESGTAALFDTKSFKISVGTGANTAPHIGSVPDQTIAAGAKLTVGNVALDTDVPANTLTFSLATGPTGATIDPVTGVLTWTPTAGQVGKTQIQVKVSDNGVPSLSATNSFFVTVAGATGNTAPSIQVPADQSIGVGSALNVTVTATDSDVPAQTLTFSLVAAPTGVSINPTTGALTWTPTSAQVGVNQIQVRVTDSGIPPLSATNSFNVTVTSGTASAATLRLVSVLTAGSTLEVRGQAGASYDIEYSTDLINWSPLTTVSLGAQTLATYLDTVHGFGQQKGFYRAKSGGSAQPSAPTIKPQAIGAGGFTLRVTGDLGATYRIQFSTDLTNWSQVGTVALTTATTADFVDTAQPTRGSKGFYRAIFP